MARKKQQQQEMFTDIVLNNVVKCGNQMGEFMQILTRNFEGRIKWELVANDVVEMFLDGKKWIVSYEHQNGYTIENVERNKTFTMKYYDEQWNVILKEEDVLAIFNSQDEENEEVKQVKTKSNMKKNQNKEEKTILCVDNEGFAVEYVSNFKVLDVFIPIIRFDGLAICNVPPLEEMYEQKNKRKLGAILKKYLRMREQGYDYMFEDWNLYKKD